jgi:hypothetical protein
VISLSELRHRRIELRELPLGQSIGLLRNVGNYYEEILPSSMSFAFIKETEKLLNDLYVRCVRETNSARLSTSILDALSEAGALSLAVKHRDFGPDFVRLGKQLGRTLIMISNSIN